MSLNQLKINNNYICRCSFFKKPVKLMGINEVIGDGALVKILYMGRLYLVSNDDLIKEL